MGLFFEVLSAINNPKQDASIQQLSQITNSVQQLAQQNEVEPDAMQSVMTNLGPMVGPLLKQQMGGNGAGNMVGNLMNMATGGGGMGALASMITPQMMQSLGQQSGVDAGKLQSLLPGLLPIVMQVMNMGNDSGGSGNPILSAFLGGSKGGADLGSMMKFANRFMNPPQ
ncbi:MAG: DUF937 domain-containing protein [Cyanobacteria bacterium P01_F01_bin.150]